MVRGLNSVRGTRFFSSSKSQDWFWGLPVSYSVCTGFPSWGQIGRRVILTIHLHLAPKLRMRGGIQPFSLHTFPTWTVTDCREVGLVGTHYFYVEGMELELGPSTDVTAYWCARGKLRKATISFVMSVLPSACNNLSPTRRTFLKFDIWVFFENLCRKFKFYWNLTRITDTLRERVCRVMVTSRWILLRTKNISEKVIEKIKIKTHILCSF
jgi:hypothetical protein